MRKPTRKQIRTFSDQLRNLPPEQALQVVDVLQQLASRPHGNPLAAPPDEQFAMEDFQCVLDGLGDKWRAEFDAMSQVRAYMPRLLLLKKREIYPGGPFHWEEAKQGSGVFWMPERKVTALCARITAILVAHPEPCELAAWLITTDVAHNPATPAHIALLIHRNKVVAGLWFMRDGTHRWLPLEGAMTVWAESYLEQAHSLQQKDLEPLAQMLLDELEPNSPTPLTMERAMAILAGFGLQWGGEFVEFTMPMLERVRADQEAARNAHTHALQAAVQESEDRTARTLAKLQADHAKAQVVADGVRKRADNLATEVRVLRAQLKAGGRAARHQPERDPLGAALDRLLS